MKHYHHRHHPSYSYLLPRWRPLRPAPRPQLEPHPLPLAKVVADVLLPNPQPLQHPKTMATSSLQYPAHVYVSRFLPSEEPLDIGGSWPVPMPRECQTTRIAGTQCRVVERLRQWTVPQKLVPDPIELHGTTAATWMLIRLW